MEERCKGEDKECGELPNGGEGEHLLKKTFCIVFVVESITFSLVLIAAAILNSTFFFVKKGIFLIAKKTLVVFRMLDRR